MVRYSCSLPHYQMTTATQHMIEDQAAEELQVIPNNILAAAANGLIDLNELAARELGNRGYDKDGCTWVGFKVSKKEEREIARFYSDNAALLDVAFSR